MEREMGLLSQLGLGDFGAAFESLSPLLLADPSMVDQLFEKLVGGDSAPHSGLGVEGGSRLS